MNDTVGASVVVIIVMGFFLLGWKAGTAPYYKDTFECTNVCGGKHSIQFDNACYCLQEKP